MFIKKEKKTRASIERCLKHRENKENRENIYAAHNKECVAHNRHTIEREQIIAMFWARATNR
jgi:hypothetical protein